LGYESTYNRLKASYAIEHAGTQSLILAKLKQVKT